MQLVVLGLNHKTAPVDIREAYSFSEEEVKQSLEHLYEHDDIAETVILSTCNRTEIYAVLEEAMSQEEARAHMLALVGHLKETDITVHEEYFFFYEGEEALNHLFTVASSLDSLVIGEGQILSQVKKAYVLASRYGATGPIINIVFQKAISIGKKVRNITDIANTPVSVSYAAVNLAADCLPDLGTARVLLLGAGQMSELTATHLQAKGVRAIFVSNRTYHRAEELAKKFSGEAVPFHHSMEFAEQADIIITSTGAPHYMITHPDAQSLMEKRAYKPLVIIDIAVPRDVDPDVAGIKGVSLFNIDALEAVVEENKHHRLEEAERAKPIIVEAVREIMEKLTYLSVRPLMVLISEKAERIRRREYQRAMAKLQNLPEKERKIMENMSRMLVRKLLRGPMIKLHEVAGKDEESEYWDFFRAMFEIQKEQEDEKCNSYWNEK